MLFCVFLCVCESRWFTATFDTVKSVNRCRTGVVATRCSLHHRHHHVLITFIDGHTINTYTNHLITRKDFCYTNTCSTHDQTHFLNIDNSAHRFLCLYAHSFCVHMLHALIRNAIDYAPNCVCCVCLCDRKKCRNMPQRERDTVSE